MQLLLIFKKFNCKNIIEMKNYGVALFKYRMGNQFLGESISNKIRLLRFNFSFLSLN